MPKYTVILWEDLESLTGIDDSHLDLVTWEVASPFDAIDKFVENNLEGLLCGYTYESVQQALAGKKRKLDLTFAVKEQNGKWMRVTAEVEAKYYITYGVVS